MRKTQNGRYQARFTRNKSQKYLGTYDNFAEANIMLKNFTDRLLEIPNPTEDDEDAIISDMYHKPNTNKIVLCKGSAVIQCISIREASRVVGCAPITIKNHVGKSYKGYHIDAL